MIKLILQKVDKLFLLSGAKVPISNYDRIEEIKRTVIHN